MRVYVEGQDGGCARGRVSSPKDTSGKPKQATVMHVLLCNMSSYDNSKELLDQQRSKVCFEKVSSVLYLRTDLIYFSSDPIHSR